VVYPPAGGPDLVAGPLPATCVPVSGSAQFRVTVTYAWSGAGQDRPRRRPHPTPWPSPWS